MVVWRPEHLSGLLLQFSRQFVDRPELHDISHAVLDAGRRDATVYPGGAEVAEFGREGDVSYVELTAVQLLDVFEDLDAFPAHRVVMFLFACDFASVAAGAVVVVN